MNDLGTRLDELAASAVRGVGLTDPAAATERVVAQRPTSKNLRPLQLAAAIAVVVCVIASAVVLGQRWQPTSSSVVAASGSADTTDDTTSSDSTVLLPTTDTWVVVESYEPNELTDAHRHPGVWVWRVDNSLVILAEGLTTGLRESASVADAQVIRSNERSMMSWVTDAGEPLGLVAFSSDAFALREYASALVPDGNTWVLPGAEVVFASPDSSPLGPRSAQLEFSPVNRAGVADLGVRVTGTSHAGSAASMYFELVEVGGLGPVSEIDIAGHTGVLVSGAGPGAGSWAAVAAHDRVFTWDTLNTTASVDQLQALLDSLEPVPPAALATAIFRRDDEILKAVTAAAIDPADIAAPVDLPRFRLPEGWSLDWATDKGIWTNEQRATEMVMVEAQRPERSSDHSPTAQRRQAFALDKNPLVPVFTIVTSTFDAPQGQPAAVNGTTPITVAGLTGSITNKLIELNGTDVRSWVFAPSLFQRELEDLGQSLLARDNDPKAGFDVVDERYVEVFDIVEQLDPDAGWPPPDMWTARWRNDAEAFAAQVTVSHLSFDEFQEWLMQLQPDIAVHAEITGGPNDPFIESHWNHQQHRSGTWRYDTETQLLIEVEVNGSGTSASDVLPLLIPIGVDVWADLAEPFNADPLNPR